MNTPLIGIIGRKRSGKDTLAATLVDELGYERVAFADPLKRVLEVLDPILGTFPLTIAGQTQVREWRLSEALEVLGWEALKDYAPESRRGLQMLGEGIRAEAIDFWLDRGLAPIDGRTTPVVVTDVRYLNEAEAIVARGGIIVRVARPSVTAEGVQHISETALDAYPEDLTILNVGTLADLADGARLADDFAAL